MTYLLEIDNLYARVEDAPIINGLTLRIKAGEIHAIMGPNGSGKSTLSYVLAGKEGYEVTSGSIKLNGEDILSMTPEERATRGMFLAFQYPLEIPGVSNMMFFRVAFNALRRRRGEEELDVASFLKLVRKKSTALGISDDMLRRSVNTGFSGGEKKRNEMLQMSILEPIFAVLDETDSGLDIDALKIVSKGINGFRSPERAMMVITHYQRLLDYIKPDIVHILIEGKIVKTGDVMLAYTLEKKGYAEYVNKETVV